MINIRHSEERGHADHGWLDTRHSFSFADYQDPQQMGFRSLRVINQDRVTADSGFLTHPHQEMEIISLVLKGKLQHRDSMGNEGAINAGEVQRMSAGTGIRHSEWNPSKEYPVEFLQIWILPNEKGLTPSYQQRTTLQEENQQHWTLLASPNARDGSVSIHQDVDLWRGHLPQNKQTSLELLPNRHAWLQLIEGELQINGKCLRTGDGAAISDLKKLNFDSIEGSDFLLFDLA